MKPTFAGLLLVSVASIAASALTGCPSKESSSSSGATAPPSGMAPNGGGPLANLESAAPINETWMAQEGNAPMPFVFYAQQNVRLSAPCRQPNGQLSCDAIRQLRNAIPVEIPRRQLTGNVSAGTKACMKLGQKLVSGRSSVGAEDGFCRFPDGSMVSTGALEQYGLRITE